MRKITVNDFNFSIPSTWNELTDDDLLVIADMVNDKQSSGIIGIELLLRYMPFNIVDRDRIFNGGEQCFVFQPKNDPEADQVLIPLGSLTHLASNGFSWLFTDEYDVLKKDFLFKITSTLTRSPFVETVQFPFIGPKSGLTNITFDEYIVSNTHLDQYSQDGLESTLNLFCATLYRTKRQGTEEELLRLGDFRKEFNDFAIENDATAWVAIPITYKLCILWFYLGCMNELKRFKALGRKAAKSNEPVYLASAKLVDVIAGGDVTKNAAVRKTYLYEVLIHLDRVIEGNEASEKLLKK